ncbi:hypothetical protein [Rheinheimera sp.]|uniref:hypothetical protein n=1 Tax=Rheinheimera sp. TaxID=1869214 RepID=UPI0027B887C8|nr:hypothetical protein [Rheinheimera sp.]
MEELFNHYAAAFDGLKPELIAALYRLPCAISDADGVQVFTDTTSLLSKFTKNCDSLRNLGYQKALFNILSVEPLGQKELLVHVGWRVHTINSAIDFRALYICHHIAQDWFIYSANVYPGTFGHI